MRIVTEFCLNGRLTVGWVGRNVFFMDFFSFLRLWFWVVVMVIDWGVRLRLFFVGFFFLGSFLRLWSIVEVLRFIILMYDLFFGFF